MKFRTRILRRLAAVFAVAGVAIAGVGTAEAQPITDTVLTKSTCRIPRHGPDQVVHMDTVWTIYYTRPVMIKPEFVNIYTLNPVTNRLQKMTSYDLRLYLDRTGALKIHKSSSRDDFEYGWQANGRQPKYRALDYPIWWAHITTSSGACTVRNHHISW